MWRIIITIIVALLIGGGAFWYFRATDTAPSAAVIVLRENGFDPQEITIKRGSTVTFSSETGNQFWPASNLHPSHSIYPAFDPERPLQPGETWEFVFDRVGDWGFHDHVRSYFIGTIHVVD